MKRVTTLSLVVALALLISACNFPFTNTESAMATSVAATVDAMEEAHGVVPTLAPLPTQAPPEPTYPPVPTPGRSSGPGNECLYAAFISETIKDNTEFTPGESFTKTWTLRNDGYCDWNEDYHLVFKSGTQMGGASDTDFGIEIDPGEDITLSVDLTAPSTAGTYTGYWQLETDDDVKFGSALSARIKVAGTSSTFQVTSVSTSLADDTLACTAAPYDLAYTVYITANGAGDVTFYTVDSLGNVSATDTLVFGEAGTRTVSGSITIPTGGDGDYWVKVYIQDPNNQWFGPYDFTITCS